MTPTVSSSVGAAIVAVLAVAVAATVARAARSASGESRAAYRLCTWGFLICGLGLATAAGWIGTHGRDDRSMLAIAVVLSLPPPLILAGTLRMDGRRRPTGVAMRRGAEGLLLVSCGAYVTWSLLIGPLPMTFLGTPLDGWDKTVGLLLLAPSGLVVCVCGTVAWRTRRAGSGPMVGTIALYATAGASVWVAWGHDSVAAILAATAVYGGSLAAIAWQVRQGVGVSDEPRGPEHAGTLLAWVPVSVAIVACVTHLAIYHRADNTSILIATVIGAALGMRQAFAMRDIRAYASELARREARYRELAHTDPLTNLSNRRAFAQMLDQQVMGGRPSVVLSIDLDGFKNINDLRGHDIGDAVLVEVARRLRANLRPDDIAARLGGDEFAVVLWLRHEEATAAAGRLRSVLAAPYEIAGSPVFLSASIGLAPAEGATDVAELMRNADLALRFAKLRGKNRVEGYAEAYAQWLRRRTTVETELRGAIARGEFSVLYQPVVSLRTGGIVGVEALLRWLHPTLGAVLPREFVPIAEDSHLIESIGRWMLGETCRQLSRWVGDGWDIWLAVNVSVQELHRSDFVTQVTDVLRAHRLPAARLVLEVAEHAVAVDIDELVDSMTALRAAGVRVALDDFGAGYSALGQMHLVPADILKVDAAVIAASPEADAMAARSAGAVPGRPRSAGAAPAGSAPASCSLADVVVRLGERLSLDVIVSGVTETAQRSAVEAAGYALAQGDLFARAMPAEHLEARLAAELVPMPRPAS